MDDDARTSWVSGVFSGRIGKENSELGEALLQYCCYFGNWDVVNIQQDSGEKARVSTVNAEC